jgi:pyrroline-5-carboxylate reductase
MVKSKIQQTIGFVGAGQMARALAAGFVSQGLVDGTQVVTFDPDPDAAHAFCQAAPRAAAATANAEVVRRADVIFLAVKPQVVPELMGQMAEVDMHGKLIVSIVAGVTLSSLTEKLRTPRVIRIMPNTPCLIGKGAAAYSRGPGATIEDGRLVKQLIESVAYVEELPEPLLDAVTGLSGSGPAYVYQMIEALSDGGVRMGLPRQTATRLAAATVMGAGAMVQSSGEHPAVLKDRVTSPGGTTIAGLQSLERHGFRAAVMAAVEAATLRSRELGAGKVS